MSNVAELKDNGGHVQLSVIVNGTLTVVEARNDTKLSEVIVKALNQTGNHGQPPENWELRDEAGNVLDPQLTVEHYHLHSGAKLFLNLKAGVGGEAVRPLQAADPSVSLAKFRREIAEFRLLEDDYRRRGWMLLKADYPTVLVALAATKLRPIPIVAGVLFDYTNYDASPPSVRLVDPFTEEPYRMQNLHTRMLRAKPQEAPPMMPGLQGMPAGLIPQIQFVEQLLQSYGEDDIPFLCLPGVREYHSHPAHTGDAWELQRASGAGKLVRLLEIIYRYGVEPVTDYNVTLVPQISLAVPRPAQ